VSVMRGLVALLVACGHPAMPAPPTSPAAERDPLAKSDGTEHSVCHWGARMSRPLPAPAACKAGLQCCYPCGIPGCNSECMAVASCPTDIP